MNSFIQRNIQDRIMHFSRHNPLTFEKIKALKVLDQVPEAQLQEMARNAALITARHAFAHSDFYRSLYRGKTLKDSFDDHFCSLPIIDKNDIRDQERSIATRPLQLMKKGVTSGTTGASLSVYRTPGSILNEYAYVWYYRMAHGIKKGDPVVSLRAKLKRDQLFYFNSSENILYISPFLLSLNNIDKLVDLLTLFKPKAIFSYPSFICNLVHLLGMKNHQLKIPLIFTSSETLYAHQREKIQGYFGARIFDWYGNVERTIALGECDFGNYHEMPMYSFNEYKPDGIITTAFINNSYPLVRYRVEDRIVKLNETCKCGKQHLIRSIEGRINDSLFLRDGTCVSGLSVGYAFIEVKNIRFAQVIQKTPDHIEVNVVPDQQFCKENQDQLMNNLISRLPDFVTMQFNKIEEDGIIKAKSGKFKLVISDLC